MSAFDNLSPEERARMSQLFDDIQPYYARIAVTLPDKSFIAEHHDQCLRMALAGKEAILAHKDMKPEEAIYSDDLFAHCIEYAWHNVFTESDQQFLNTYLKPAAECFRMGFMLADLPEI